MGNEKITYKTKDNKLILTLIEDECPYFIEGDYGDREIIMSQLDGEILPLHFESYFDFTTFVILFNEYLYHNEKWYLLKEPYSEVKVVCIYQDPDYSDKPFECPSSDYLLYRIIQKNNTRKYFGDKYTLFIPVTNDTKKIKNYTTKSIILSHVVPGKQLLKQNDEFRTMCGTKLKFNASKNTIDNTKIVSQIEKENCMFYFISDYLPVVESKDNVEYWNEILNQMLVEYLSSKIKNMMYHLNTIVDYLEEPNKNKMFSLALMEPETSQLLRRFYNQKK